MMYSRLLPLILLVGTGAFVWTGCDRDDGMPEPDPEVSSTDFQDVKREAREAARATGDYLGNKASEAKNAIEEAYDDLRDATYDERVEFQAAAQQSLEKLDAEWEEFKASAADRSDEAWAETEEFRQEAGAKLEATKDASAEAWTEVRDGFSEAYEELKQSLAEAKEKYQDDERDPPADAGEEPF